MAKLTIGSPDKRSSKPVEELEPLECFHKNEFRGMVVFDDDRQQKMIVNLITGKVYDVNLPKEVVGLYTKATLTLE